MGIAAAAPAASDAELIDASRRGEHAAFGRLVERYQALVCAVSFTATGDRALSEDVAQETFLVAWHRLGELRETARLRPWLCGIARNLGRMARRDGRRAMADDMGQVDIAAGDASPFDAVVEAEAQRIVRDTLSRVPERYREALVLYYQNDRSAREVAAALGISENAALQRLSRGRKYLADSVTDLVERSLADNRPRRALPAVVVAALPAAGLPRVATPSHGGWTMLKLSLALTALAAAGGTTAYVVHRSGSDPSPPASVAAPAESRPTLPPPSTARPWREAPKLAAPPAAPQRPAGAVVIPEREPTLDKATLARLALDRGPSRGPADAPVTIIVFTDFQCGYCGKVLGTIDELWDEYPGKLRLVVKQFPVHTTAVLASEAALAAEDQGRFWELHDLMMANQDDLSEKALLDYGARAGLDVKKLKSALAGRTYRAAVEKELEAGKQADVKGTPCFFINGKQFTGARPIEQFRREIDSALADAR